MSNASNELAEKLKRQHAKTEESCFENLPEATSADVLARRRRSIPDAHTGLVEKQRERMESAVTASSSEGYPETRDGPAKSKATGEQKEPETTLITEPEIVEAEPSAIAEEEPQIAAQEVEPKFDKGCTTADHVARLGIPIVFRDSSLNMHTVHAERGPLGLKFPFDKLPIVITKFMKDSYGEQLGIQIGWTMISFGGVELSSLQGDGVSEAEGFKRIMKLMSDKLKELGQGV